MKQSRKKRGSLKVTESHSNQSRGKKQNKKSETEEWHYIGWIVAAALGIAVVHR